MSVNGIKRSFVSGLKKGGSTHNTVVLYYYSFIKDIGGKVSFMRHQHPSLRALDPLTPPPSPILRPPHLSCICFWLSPVHFLWGSHVSLLLLWIAMLHYKTITLSAGGPTCHGDCYTERNKPPQFSGSFFFFFFLLVTPQKKALYICNPCFIHMHFRFWFEYF